MKKKKKPTTSSVQFVQVKPLEHEDDDDDDDDDEHHTQHVAHGHQHGGHLNNGHQVYQQHSVGGHQHGGLHFKKKHGRDMGEGGFGRCVAPAIYVFQLIRTSMIFAYWFV